MKKLIIIFALLIIAFLTIYYRVILPDWWLHGDTLKLPTVDAYYQARFAQVINSHGTDLPERDPYFMYGENYGISDVTLWPTIISTLSQLFPSNGIDTVCYYLPPILALLCVIGVFFIGAMLFNPWAGLFASLLLATMGGEFMARSIAGSADYHAFEAFCLVGFTLCIVSSVKYHNNGIANWLGSIFAGFIMSMYFMAWSGAVYLYLIFTASYVAYLVILSLKIETPSGAILQIPCVVIPSTILFYIIISNLTGSHVDDNILIVSAVFFTVCLFSTLVQIFFANRNNRWGLLFIIVAVGILSMGFLYTYISTYYQYVQGIVTSLIEWNAISFTSEERPILIFGDEFSLQALWGNFTTSIFLCLIGAGVLVRKILKADRHDLFNYLFITLGALTMVISTLAMVRFAYYLAIYTAILAGMIVFIIIEVSTKYLKRNTKKMKWFDKAGDYLLITVMLVFIFVPNFMISRQFSSPLEGSLTGGWEQAMTWMRDNTPEPFPKDYYYANYNNNMQKPTYSVLSWWDYGYWITYIAHRVPTCNPGSENRDIPAVFLTTTSIDNSIKVLQSSKSRYIVIDYQTATGKFAAMPTYAGKATGELKNLWSWETPGYISTFNMDDKGKIQRMTIFHPDYYKSMAVRLFNFDGQSIKSPGCPVIIYKDINGQKWIQKIIDTPSYEEALNYIEKNPLTDGTLYTYGGTDPFLSCVDLPQVKDIVPIKGFGGVNLEGMSQALKQTYEVKVFQYTGEF